MPFRNILLLLVCWTVLQTIGSCCNCGKDWYRWENLRLAPGVFRDGGIDTVAQGGSVSGDSLAVRMRLEAVYDALRWEGLPRFQTAAACKCGLNVRNVIQDIHCISVRDWDSTHRAGSDITGILEARGSGGGLSLSRDEAADTLFRPLTGAVGVFNSGQALYVRPTSSRIMRGPQQLLFTLTLENGRTIRSTVDFVVQ